MSLESATYINQLNILNPTGTDLVSTADDHIRLIKSTLKNTFPNVTGPVNLSQSELNSNQFLVDTGTTNNIVVTPSPAWTSYASGKGFTVKILNNTTTVSPVINVSGLGNQNIVTSDGLPVVLYSNSIYDFVHNGTSFVLKNMYVKKAYTDEVTYNPVLQTYTSVKSTSELRLGSNSTDQLTINTSGNVGIGNTAPVYGLDITKTTMSLISGTSLVSFALGNQTNTSAITSDNSYLKLNCSTAGNNIEIGKYVGSPITLSTASVERVKIKANGSINIGSVFATDTARIGISAADNPTGFATLLELKNESAGATSPSKFIRITSTGTLEIRNSANSSSILTLADDGVLTPSGGIPAGNVTAGTFQDGMMAVQQSINDSSYKLATTNWVNRASYAATSGTNYFTLPSGQVMVWGFQTLATANAATTISLGSTFNGKTVINAQATWKTGASVTQDLYAPKVELNGSTTPPTFIIRNSMGTAFDVYWQAILV